MPREERKGREGGREDANAARYPSFLRHEKALEIN